MHVRVQRRVQSTLQTPTRLVAVRGVLLLLFRCPITLLPSTLVLRTTVHLRLHTHLPVRFRDIRIDEAVYPRTAVWAVGRAVALTRPVTPLRRRPLRSLTTWKTPVAFGPVPGNTACSYNPTISFWATTCPTRGPRERDTATGTSGRATRSAPSKGCQSRRVPCPSLA